MGQCQLELRQAGKAYPRTCPTCGLSGACVKGLSAGVPDRNPQGAAMTDLGAAKALMDGVAHEEQVRVWAEELAMDLDEDLREIGDQYDDAVRRSENLRWAVGRLAEKVLTHPALIAEVEALRADKWAEKHTDTMNDMVLMGMARDEANARAEAAETALRALTADAGAQGEAVPMWCDGCRATGAIHCAHPDHCGNMKSATASVDNWKAWLDDLPLSGVFDPAIGRLQDFLTALAALIDMPQPAPPSDPVQEAARVLLDAGLDAPLSDEDRAENPIAAKAYDGIVKWLKNKAAPATPEGDSK